jgi:hypothetical protein
VEGNGRSVIESIWFYVYRLNNDRKFTK